MKTLDDLKIECLSRYILGTDPELNQFTEDVICSTIDYLHAKGLLTAWQPMETAPKDGSGFIGYQKISDEQYVISACAFYGEFVWINWGEGLNTSANPTHWMPLPKLPEVN